MTRPTTAQKNKLPLDIRYAYSEGVDLYKCIENYENGILTDRQFIGEIRRIKATYAEEFKADYSLGILFPHNSKPDELPRD